MSFANVFVYTLAGFKDMGECWRQANYEDKNFDEVAAKLWVTVEPIYKKLHAYVRRKLMNQYPGRGISATGPIPAHLLGSNCVGQFFTIRFRECSYM